MYIMLYLRVWVLLLLMLLPGVLVTVPAAALLVRLLLSPLEPVRIFSVA